LTLLNANIHCRSAPLDPIPGARRQWAARRPPFPPAKDHALKAALDTPPKDFTVKKSPAAVVLKGVSQVFRSSDGDMVDALSGVDLSIERREFVSIIGPSGCGKSTILRLISGLLGPTSGEITVFGHPMVEPRDDIGFVFQRPTLLPWLRILENVTFPVRHTTGRVDAETIDRAQQLLKMMHLSDFTKKLPRELSGGMQQRVAIARALLQDPDILLMDEPFSALDALTRDELSIELLSILAERPKTVVFVTHSIPEALLLSDRIAVMSPRPGRIQEIIDVTLPRPRGLDTMLIPSFNEMANDIRRKVFSKVT
jgi:NitT/TauT family transport system ATP-binding protein